MWGGGRECQGAARAGWTGRERSGVGGRGGSARGRLCTSPRFRGGARFERARGWEKETRRGVATARGAGGRTHPYSGTRRWIRTSCTTATTATTAYAPASASNVRSCEEEEAGEQGQTDAPRGGERRVRPGRSFFFTVSRGGERGGDAPGSAGRRTRTRGARGARRRRSPRARTWSERASGGVGAPRRAQSTSLEPRPEKSPAKEMEPAARAEKKQLARVASASLRPVQGKRPRSRRRHSPHSPRRHHVARTREDARRGGARG